MAIKIIEHCHVAPSPDTTAEQSLQLLHFDMIWFPFHLMQNLFFYSFRCSESHFSDTVVPSLKKSLSLALKQFPPLAGKIIFPLFTGMPVSRYVEGDSVSITIAVSDDADLIPLTGNLSRDPDRFHDFVPELPPADYTDMIDFYVAAIQSIDGDVLIIVGQNAPHVSSFAVICAYVWTCLAKSTVDDVADDEPEYFNCTADCRRRLNPPLPDNYFGNCLGLVQAESTHGRLKGKEGIVFGAEVINEAIQKTVNNETAILEGSIVGFLERRKLIGKRVFGVTGSPRFDLYGADFGWGKPKKFEVVHIDCGGSVSLCKSREFKGGVEIGLSMKKVEMDAFEAIFNQGFKEAM